MDRLQKLVKYIIKLFINIFCVCVYEYKLYDNHEFEQQQKKLYLQQLNIICIYLEISNK